MLYAEMYEVGGDRQWVGTLHMYAEPVNGVHRLYPMSMGETRVIYINVIQHDTFIGGRNVTDDERLIGFGQSGFLAHIYELGGRQRWMGTMLLNAVPIAGHYRLCPLYLQDICQVPVTCYPSCRLS